MSGSKLIGLMRQQASGIMPSGIELATVITPPPDLRVRIDNMDLNLEGDDLLVCEHVLEHSREYSTISGVSGSDMTEAGLGPHKHSITSVTVQQQNITLHSKLQAGDRVVVMALPGGQKYLIWDKVVSMGA